KPGYEGLRIVTGIMRVRNLRRRGGARWQPPVPSPSAPNSAPRSSRRATTTPGPTPASAPRRFSRSPTAGPSAASPRWGCSGSTARRPSASGWTATSTSASPGFGSRGAAGASPPFPPCGLSEEQATEQVLQAVRRSPRLSGVAALSRWTLSALSKAVAWMACLKEAAICRILRRLGVRYRRGQEHPHSPDPEYDTKMQAVLAARDEAHVRPGQVVFLYLDELTYYRRPSVARAWQAEGGPGR